MEEKKAYKIGVMPLFLLILDILLIIVVIVMGLIIYTQQKKLNNMEITEVDANESAASVAPIDEPEENIVNEIIEDKEENIVSNQVVKTTNTNTVSENNVSEENGYARKIVDNRAYIYDAQYPANGIKVNSYSSSDGNTYAVSDIIVPYINMVSSDASAMNQEIEGLYNQYIDEFVVCSQNKNSYIKVSYNSYITSNIYSILLTVQRGQGTSESSEYIAYNFDILSGTKLDYNQVCYVAGITNASETIQTTIDNLDDYNSYYLVAGRFTTQEQVDERSAEIENCRKQIYTSYQEDLLNNKLVYFLDNNLKLNIVVKIGLPNNEGSYSKLVVVEV